MSSHPSEAELTPKQKQVLALLQAGKTNKDIANTLGIGAGTVKQHLVTIFRKLGVNNRTMAAVQHTETIPNVAHKEVFLTQDPMLLTHPTDSYIERRPCVLLTIKMADHIDSHTLLTQQAFLAHLIAHHHGTLISRAQNQQEIIFGLERTDPLNPLYALSTALQLAQQWITITPEQPNTFCAYLSFGIILASMDHHGHWTEEVLMSTMLGQARAAIQYVPFGALSMTSSVRDQLRLQGIELNSPTNTATFDHWHITFSPHQNTPIAIDETITKLINLLNNPYDHNPISLLVGQTGMGKSLLLSQLHQYIERKTPNSSLYFRLLPNIFDPLLSETTPAGSIQHLTKHVHYHNNQKHNHITTLLIDDLDCLNEKERHALIHLIEEGSFKAVISSNTALNLHTLRHIHHVECPRLNAQQMQTLAEQISHKCTPQLEPALLQHVTQLAQYNPLYLTGMLQTCTEQISLSLVTSIMAYIDSLHLNRAVLRQLLLSKTRQSHSISTEIVRQSIIDAINTGILVGRTAEHVSFASPIIETVLKQMLIVFPDSEMI